MYILTAAYLRNRVLHMACTCVQVCCVLVWLSRYGSCGATKLRCLTNCASICMCCSVLAARCIVRS